MQKTNVSVLMRLYVNYNENESENENRSYRYIIELRQDINTNILNIEFVSV